MTIQDEAFNDMLFDYYDNLDEELEYYEVMADLLEKVAGFVNALTEIEDNAVYLLTDKGRQYLEEMRRSEKIQRHDELMEKYYNFSIDFEEYAELQRLKEELNDV